MLVPAIAFGWWLVSMSPPQPTGIRSRAVAESAAPAEAVSDRPEEDTANVGSERDDGTDEATNNETNGDDDVAGQRFSLKVVTPEIVRAARTFLDLPMGTERSLTIDGRRYVFVLERHYHPPGFVGGPHGWHKGVTVYGVR